MGVETGVETRVEMELEMMAETAVVTGSSIGSGSGGKGRVGDHTSAARSLPVSMRVAAAVFAMTVWQALGFLAMALFTLPVLAQASTITNASTIAIYFNITSSVLLGLDVDQKGRGGGRGYVSGASSTAPLMAGRLFAGTALAVLVQQGLVGLPFTLLAFAAIARAEIPISTNERSTAIQAAPTATEIVQ
ncbi:hypothetical protein MMC26_002689 [Xylographa opegraphella]|nr:hypothetical protein [Xylographa opegraphella]